MPLPNIIEFIGTNITQRKFQQAQEKLLNYLGVEVPTKTELNSEISKLNNAITPKADKIYVDSALSSFQNGALKTYPTLAEANADIANIALNTKVSVLSVENGGDYYKATAGATILTKSPYDVLEQAKIDAASKVDKNISKALSILGEQPFKFIDTTTNAAAGYYSSVGTWIADTNYNTSDFIAVKAGDCILMHQVNSAANFFSRGMLFDANKNPIGALNCVKIEDLTTLKSDTKLNLNVDDKAIKSNQNIGIIVPQDGFIKLSNLKTIVNMENDLTDYFAVITNQESLIDAMFTHCVPKALLKKLKSKWITPIIDSDIANNGQVLLSTGAVGTTQAYTASNNTAGAAVSKKYAVKKGQFIHIFGTAYGRNLVANIVSEADVILQNIDNVSAFSTYNTNLNNPIGFFNIEVLQDGFIRVALSGAINTPQLLAITDDAVADIEQYYSYVKKGHKLKTYTELNPKVWATLSGFQQYGSSREITSLSQVDYDLGANAASLLKGNKPILLKKGDVLKFTSKAVAPVFARVFTLNKTLVGGISKILNDPAKTPNSEVVINNWLSWKNSGGALANAPAWLGETQETTNYICNEDYDLVVYLFSGNAAIETVYGTSNAASIDVLTIDEYKAIRTQQLLNGVPFNKGNAVNNYLDGTSTSGLILLFKDEIIGYSSNRMVVEQTPTSYYIAGSTFESLSRYFGVSGFPTSSINITYQDYISKGYDLSYKTNTTALVSISLLDFYAVDNVWSSTQRRNPTNIPLAASIYSFKEDRIGKGKLPSSLLVRETYKTNGIAPNLYLSKYSDSQGDIDTRAGFVKKGKYYAIYGVGIEKADFLPFSGVANGAANIQTLLPVAQCNKVQGKYCFTPSEDGMVIWNSFTAPRETSAVDRFANLPPTQWYMQQYYNHDLYEISEAEYLSFTKTYTQDALNLPEDGSVNLNILSRFGSSVYSDNESVIQIRVGTEVVATVKALTANQGQSSASSAKQNINIEFLNASGKSLYLKFGDKIEEAELVAKSYFGSDKSHLRDTACTEIWHQIRTFENYPAEGVIPASVLADTSLDLSRYKARGTTFGIPCEVFVNDNPLGLFTIRNKKKRGNYAMKKKNKNHILLQADYSLSGGYMSFADMRLNSSEIRNPEIANYVAGDTTLSDTVVQANIQNFFDWFKAATITPILFDTEGSQHINFNSWYDYIIMSELVRNWDGQNNNYLLGTWDSKIWHIFAYDLDQTLGAWGGTAQSPYGLISGDIGKMYATDAPTSRANFFKRYTKLRDSGVVSSENMIKILKSIFAKINTLALAKDLSLWSASLSGTHDLLYITDWVYKRVRYLDAVWNYLPSDSLVLKSISVGTVAAQGTKQFTYTGTSAVTTDVLFTEQGDLPPGITASATCTVNGTIVVTYSNTTPESIVPRASYIRVFREK
ncbi:CotH kinase family protein [Acinetobacter sp. YH12066]|uniref:CotH kinase family protein n=1 Tax=Acinetobacter sp. YH12066 TaxID=2601063 RepID=UPI0015D25566|nr:CotH kinase family protein [Acinetobacter sp. YH12066]